MSNPPSFSSKDAVIVRRNRWYLALAASPILLSAAAVLGGSFADKGFFTVAVHPLVLSFVTLSWMWRANPRPVERPASVDAGVVWLRVGRRSIACDALRRVQVVPAPPRVLIVPRYTLPFAISVDSTEEGWRLLRILRTFAPRTPASFRTMHHADARMRHAILAISGFTAVHGIWILAGRPPGLVMPALGIALALAIVTTMLIAFLMRTRLSVGDDGITLRSWRRTRWLSYGEIFSVDRYDRGAGGSQASGLAVTLVSGEEVLIPLGQARWDETSIAIVEEHLRKVLETFRAGADAALLRRGERAVDAWLGALRSIGESANLRAAPIPRERLFQIATAVAAQAGDRATAAVALAAALDDAGRARLRAAAETTPAPGLRALIEQVAAGGEGAALEEKLAALDAEDVERRALWARAGFGGS